MSQKRNAPPRAAGKGAAEKAAPKAPVLTPQAIGGFFGLIAVVGTIWFYVAVVKGGQDKIASIKNQATTESSNIATYKKKGGKLKEATALDKALKDKLGTLDYLFLADQNDVIPYFENTLLRLITSSNLQATSDSKIKADVYTFQINMLANPFTTLPNTPYIKTPYDLFKMTYLSEVNGVPPQVLDTRPTEFLTPYSITLEGWSGTYNDVKDFIKHLQSKTNETLITVHCFKNDDGKNAGIFRRTSEWTIKTTVYFMNPEKPATGDEPPMKQGGQSC